MPSNLNKGSDRLTQGPASGNASLRKALMARERFLEHNPHLRAYQAKIDSVLDKSGNHHGRLAVLGTLIQGNLLDMQKEFNKLTTILQQTVKAKEFPHDKHHSG